MITIDIASWAEVIDFLFKLTFVVIWASLLAAFMMGVADAISDKKDKKDKKDNDN